MNAFHHQTYRVKRLENIVYSNGKMEYISKPQGPPPSSKVWLPRNMYSTIWLIYYHIYVCICIYTCIYMYNYVNDHYIIMLI